MLDNATLARLNDLIEKRARLAIEAGDIYLEKRILIDRETATHEQLSQLQKQIHAIVTPPVTALTETPE